MNLLRILWVTAVVFLDASHPIGAKAQGHPRNPEPADSLFQVGKFTEAEKLYADALSADPKNFHAIVRLGSLALLANRRQAHLRADNRRASSSAGLIL